MKVFPVALIVAALGATPAFAHDGPHAATMAAGILHPLTGADHVLAMIAVGLWAAQRGQAALVLWPLTFVCAMVAGAMAGMAGWALPHVEPMIAASVLVLGLLVARDAAVPLGFGAALVALFAIVHGNAHGLEAAAGAPSSYVLGFTISTAALHGAGAAIGFALRSTPSLLRASGVAAAGAGVLLMAAP